MVREGTAGERRRAGRLRALMPTSPELVMCVGLGLYFAWVENTFYGSRFAEGASASAVSGLRAVYFLSIGVLLVTLLACTLAHRRVGSWLYTRACLCVAPICMSVSTLLLGTSMGVSFSLPLLLVCGLGTGVSSALCLFHWGGATSALGVREIVRVSAIAYVIATLCEVLFQAGRDFVFGSAGPELWFVLLDALCPLVSGAALLLVVTRGLVSFDLRRPACPDEGAVMAAAPDAPRGQGEARPRSVVGRLSVALIAVGFVPVSCREVNSLLMARIDGVMTGWLSLVYVGTLLIVGLVAVAIMLSFLTAEPIRPLGLCYRAVILLALVSVCLLPPAAQYHSPLLGTASVLASAAINSCHLMMWITTAGICHAHRDRTTQFFGIVRLGWTLGPLLGSLYGAGYEAGLSGSGWSYAHMILCVVLLFVVYSSVFTEKILAETLSLIPQPKRRRAPFRERLQLVAGRYGLTDREMEIMGLFAKGRDSAFIQEELSLSKSTVSTHRQHIYAKLGIHSQQELLDLLEGRGGEDQRVATDQPDGR